MEFGGAQVRYMYNTWDNWLLMLLISYNIDRIMALNYPSQSKRIINILNIIAEVYYLKSITLRFIISINHNK